VNVGIVAHAIELPQALALRGIVKRLPRFEWKRRDLLPYRCSGVVYYADFRDALALD
jgi:hypothetical protein